MNLAINAAEACGERPGTVQIQTEECELRADDMEKMISYDQVKPGRYVCLEVRDTGEGMDAATQAKIFDPFFSTKFMGRGLGLSAVLGIVRGHKGAIRLDTSPGKGTTFQLFFPAESGAIDRVENSPVEIRGQGTILVVDDEDLVLKTAKLSLERFGYKVLLACDGKQAVEVFQRSPGEISLVVLDASMPVLNGYAAFVEMQKIRPDVRVILSSGYSEAEAAKRFEGKGLAGFLQKPYTAPELARKVRTGLSSAPKAVS